MTKRVVVTGLGVISPLGLSMDETWKNLIEGKSGISKITRFDAAKLSVQIAGEVKGFDPSKWVNSKDQRKMGLFIQYGMAASTMAMASAGLQGKFGEGALSFISPYRVGVNLSAGMGGLPEIQEWDRELFQKEKKTVTPFFVPMIIPNLLSGHVGILTGAKGPNLCITTACASSAHAIGEAYRMISSGQMDLMISGGAEAVICELGIAGFASMKALSQRNDAPEKASRPYDKNRDGFILGEGAATLILEEYEHAKKRGATILGEVLGYSLTSDAYHITSPSPDGAGAEACMRFALESAKLAPESIDYINTHGTSTPAGDAQEALAVSRVFSNTLSKLHVSSTKSMTGHLLGAAGALEAAISLWTIREGRIAPTINLEELDSECAATGINFTANRAVEKPVQKVLSNSFGFGGTNASLVLGAAS